MFKMASQAPMYDQNAVQPMRDALIAVGFTELLTAKDVEEAEKLFENFHALVTGNLGNDYDISELGKLGVFAGVQEFPVRVKCASLAWHTMETALHQNGKEITTE